MWSKLPLNLGKPLLRCRRHAVVARKMFARFHDVLRGSKALKQAVLCVFSLCAGTQVVRRSFGSPQTLLLCLDVHRACYSLVFVPTQVKNTPLPPTQSVASVFATFGTQNDTFPFLFECIHTFVLNPSYLRTFLRQHSRNLVLNLFHVWSLDVEFWIMQILLFFEPPNTTRHKTKCRVWKCLKSRRP